MLTTTIYYYQKRALYPVLNAFKPEFTIVINFHPLQAANWCRNPRLVGDEDDLEWVAIKINILLLLKRSLP